MLELALALVLVLVAVTLRVFRGATGIMQNNRESTKCRKVVLRLVLTFVSVDVSIGGSGSVDARGFVCIKASVTVRV